MLIFKSCLFTTSKVFFPVKNKTKQDYFCYIYLFIYIYIVCFNVAQKYRTCKRRHANILPASLSFLFIVVKDRESPNSSRREIKEREKSCKLSFYFSRNVFELPAFVSLCNWNWKGSFTLKKRTMISMTAEVPIKSSKVTKQTGRCLTLSPVRLDLLSCCFCPGFCPNPYM